MPDTPLENWDLVPGTLVAVHKDGMMLRTGRIDAVTLDADIVWLANNGSHPPVPPRTREANRATVGASNTTRTERSAFKLVLTAAIKRIADNESPPRSKNESSTPTRSSPSRWA